MDGGPIPSDTHGGAPLVEGFTDLKVLGHGGFATVYSATDVVLHRRVALKVIASNHSDHRRFQRECRILASLSEVDGVVPVLAAAVASDGRPVIVMRLLDGGSLASVVRTSGPLSVGDTLRVGDRLCGALAAAHGRGIFHRDIKPDNVLFTLGGDPSLGDFGIATIDAVASSSETLGSLSPPHAPPERFVGDDNTDPAAGDVYSLGSTLYFCLAGSPPFGTAAQGGLTGLLRRVADDPVPQLERGDLPGGLQDVLETAMQKTPADRYRSMEDFASALRSIGSRRGTSLTRDQFGLITVMAVPVSTRSSTELPVPVSDDRSPEGTPTDQRSSAASLADQRQTGAGPDGAHPAATPRTSAIDGELQEGPRPPQARTNRARTLVVLAGLAMVALAGWLLWPGGSEGHVSADGHDADAAVVTSTTTTVAAESVSTVGSTPVAATGAEFAVEGGADSPLSTCNFSGSAVVTPGVQQQLSGPQTLDLGRGSTITCRQASSAERSGSLDFHAEFADLTFNSGTGAGTCTMAWADGSATQCAAQVVLDLPVITFSVQLTEGPFAGQTATAHIEGWEAIKGPDGTTIVRLVFRGALLEFA